MSSSTSSASSAKEEENDRRASLELSSSSTSSFKDGEEDDSIFSTRDEFTEDTSVDLSEMDDFDETDVLDELSISSSNLGEESDLLPSSADSNKQLLRRRRRSRENMASNQQDLLLLDRGGKDHPQLQSLPNQKTVPPSPLANRKEMSPERLNEMRAKVLSELLATEESYIEDLEVVTKYYLPPLKVILTDKEVGMVFSNIVQILAVNQTIHSALKLRIKECKPELLHQCLVADIFLDNADYLKLYSSYTINQPEAFAMITEKKKSHPTFATFVEEMQKHPVSHNLDFKSFLIKPVQRICKYPLLLRELLRYTAEDHPEYEDLAAAYQKVESVAHHVEKHNNRAENVSKMIEIQRSVTGLGKITIVQPQRTFLMEDDFVKLSSKKRRSNYPLHLFLFNDALMATKAVKKEGSSSGNSGGGSSGGTGGGGKEKYAFKGMMPIKTIIVRDMEDTSAYKYAFELIEVRTEEKRKNTAVKLSVVASAENIKLKWLKAIHDAKKAIQRGTLLTTVGGLQGRRRGDKRPRSTSSLPADILAQLKASSPSSPLGLSALGSSSIPAPSDSSSSSPLSSSGSLSLSALEDENGSECLTSYIDLNVLKGEMEKERERAEKERSLQAASAASGKQTPTKNVSIAAEALQEEGSNLSSSSTSSLSPVLSKKSSNRKGQLKHTISLSALPKLKKDSLDGTKHLRESSGNPSSKNSLSSSTSSSGQKQAVKKKAVVVRALHDPLCDGGGGPHPPPPPPPQQQDSSLRIPPRSPGRRNAAGGSGNNVVAGGGGGTAAALRKGSLPPMRLGSTNLNNKVMFGPPTQAAVTEAFQKLRPVASAHNFPRPSSSSPSQQSAPTTTTTTTKVSIPGGATLRPGKGGLSHAFLPPPPPPASLPTSSSSESLSLSSLNNSNNKGVNMNSFANLKPPPPLNLPLPGSNNLPPPLTIPPQPPLSSSTPLPLPLSLPLSSPTSTSSLSNNNRVARVISGRDTLKKKQEQDNETEHLHHRQSSPNTHTADASNNNSKHAVLLPMMIRRRKEMSETALAETRWTAMLSPRGTPSSSFFQQQMQKRGMEEREEQEAAAALNSARSQLRAEEEELRKRLKEIQYKLFALEHDNKRQQTSYYVEDDEEEEYTEEEEQDEEIDPLLMGASNEPYRRRRESINRGRRSTMENEEDMISSGSSSSSSTPTSSAPPSPLSSSTTPKGRKELEQALKKQVEEKNRWKRKYKQLKAKYRETSSTVK
ncbi:guanine nucleotide exchange factor 9 [Balamuthia mandrillaris]